MELIVPTTGKKVIDRCRICRTPFFEDEPRTRIERHIIDCTRANHDRIMAERRRMHPDIMLPWDPEYARWIQDPAKLPGIMRGNIRP
jgi:hypothetical protein